MRIEKRVLNDALRVLGKVVCQISPVELYRSIRFVGGHGVVRAMAADGVEVVSLGLSAEVFEPVDFCVEFRELRELVRIARNDVELSGTLAFVWIACSALQRRSILSRSMRAALRGCFALAPCSSFSTKRSSLNR